MTGLMDTLVAEHGGQQAWPERFPLHLSASQLTMLQRCPEQWRRRYLLGQKEAPAGAVVWGSADHYAHEQNFRQKIDSHMDLPVDEVKEAFAAGFDNAVERNGGLAEIAWGDDKPADLKDRGVQLVEAYHRQVSPSVQPTTVEERFELRIAGVPVPVVGYVDVETDPAAVERKTSKAKVSELKPDWRIQGLLYQAVKRKPVHWHVSVKTKTPAVYTPSELDGLRLEPNPAIVAATGRLVKNLADTLLAFHDRFGPDEPWPGSITHPWSCSYCGFRPFCAWWAGQ